MALQELEAVGESSSNAGSGAARAGSDASRWLDIDVDCSPMALQALDHDPTGGLVSFIATALKSHFFGASPKKSTTRRRVRDQLIILPGKRRWSLAIDVIVLGASGGNLYDVAFMAVRAALWDLRIPRTRSTALLNQRRKPGEDGEQPGSSVAQPGGDMSAFLKGTADGIRKKNLKTAGRVVDFELDDSESLGDQLDERDQLPVCVTLNLIHQEPFLDATLHEESASQSRLIVAFDGADNVCSMRLERCQELELTRLRDLLKTAHGVATEMRLSLNARMASADLPDGGLAAFP
ncbi:hypothetical protein E5Q_02823 [Mixia osmundae IAM 14324]|uniref:Ribosomal RNA-processing protein 42 n=1 Tax=Mixia osmundae (strain CBS 9802 / IAM 14324 / JCM 22182 / KY 12970) TaxID=764103 RepID=G7E002_MIXOS|nr:hypothetical protein E5Q_02823 [Mixia osmundae IAM 14324]